MAGALRIFSRLADLLDVQVARAEAVWIRVDATGATGFLTREEALAALLPADPAEGQVLGFDGTDFVWLDATTTPANAKLSEDGAVRLSEDGTIKERES